MREMQISDWTQWLDEEEFNKLQTLAEDKILLQAVEKVFCHEIYHNGVLKPGESADLSRNFLLAYVSSQGATSKNEKLGQDVRAYWWALTSVQSGVNELKKFKRQTIPERSEGNPAE